MNLSHPLDQTKTILQLDGERAKKGHKMAYRGWIDCVSKNFKEAGIRGLYRGLSFSIIRQGGMNAFKIGMYDTILETLKSDSVFQSVPSPMLAFAAGSIGL